MMAEQPHEMQLVQMHSSGAEEWYCPTCGRRFLMHWPPSYKKIVLEPGDEYAAHVGGKGGVHLSAAAVNTETEPADLLAAMGARSDPAKAPPFEEVGPVPLTDELRPWLRWMCAVGLADEPETA
jgi:hypothetical protein